MHKFLQFLKNIFEQFTDNFTHSSLEKYINSLSDDELKDLEMYCDVVINKDESNVL